MATTMYYKIDDDNILWYSGVEFDGSSLATFTNVWGWDPILNSSVTAIKPYDDNYVQWDSSVLPGVWNNISGFAPSLVDMSGIQLTVDCTSYYRHWFNATHFKFYRGCEHITNMSSTQNGNDRLQHVESIEYGLDHMPDLPNCTGIYLLFDTADITEIHFHSLSSCHWFRSAFDTATLLSTVVFHDDLPAVRDMTRMFYGCTSLETISFPYITGHGSWLRSIPNSFGDWYYSGNYIRAESMFQGCTLLTDVVFRNELYLYAPYMFQGCTSLQAIDLANIHIGYANYMFGSCTSLTAVTSIDLSYCSSAVGMFNGCTRIVNITVKGTQNLSDTSSMFQNCGRLAWVNLGALPKLASATSMFNGCTRLQYLYCSGIKDGLSSSATTSMFYNCTSLVGGNDTPYDSSHTDGTYARVDGAGGLPGYFTYNIADNYYTLLAYSANKYCGYVDVPWPCARFASGSTVELKFVGIDGWGLDYWIKWNNTTKEWDVIESQTLELEILGDTLIYAIPKYTGSVEANFTVSLSSSIAGAGELYGSGTYPAGSSVQIRAVANPGYIFQGWYEEISGQSMMISSSSDYTIQLIGRNRLLTAVFKRQSDPSDPDEPVTPEETPYDPTAPLNLPSDIISNNNGAGWMDYGDTDLYSIFLPSETQLKDFARAFTGADFLSWLQGKGLDLMGATNNIINLMVLPTNTVEKVGLKYVKFAWFTSWITSYYTNHNYHRYNCGTMHVDPVWFNSLDYNTQIQIYLPFVGLQTLNTDEVMDKDLTVEYKIDLITGDCVAQILVDGSCIYQYTGNCGYNLPLNRSHYSDIVQKMASTALAAGLSVANSNEGKALAAKGDELRGQLKEITFPSGRAKKGYRDEKKRLLKEISSNDKELAKTKSRIASFNNTAEGNIDSFTFGSAPRMGSISGQPGYLATNYPYLIIKRPNLALPDNFTKYNGYPCNKYLRLGDLTGYTEVSSIHLEGIPCTSDEMEEIESLLHNGVII